MEGALCSYQHPSPPIVIYQEENQTKKIERDLSHPCRTPERTPRQKAVVVSDDERKIALCDYDLSFS
jgi:hypothetical protein